MVGLVMGKAREPKNKSIKSEVCGGEAGIRTLDALASMPHFECGAFDHSATSPGTKAAVSRRVAGEF